jgi:hypothetical protein
VFRAFAREFETIGIRELGSANKIGGVTFDPSLVPNLIEDYNPLSLVLNNNDPVSSLASVGSGAHGITQATGTKQQLFKTNQVNGKPSIEFDGVDDFLASIAFTQNQPFTLFLVFKQITWTSADRFVDMGNPVLRQTTVTPQFQIVIGTGINASLAIGTWGLVTTVVNGALSTIAVNGAVDTSGDITGTTALNKITLGSRADGTQSANVAIARMLIYSGVVSGANQALIKTYLGSYYGLF